MIYEIELSVKFKHDLKLARKRGYDMAKLESVIDLLAQGATLPLKNLDHSLGGNYEGYRECHIAPDWLLIYRYEQKSVVLYLFRNGTHGDLF